MDSTHRTANLSQGIWSVDYLIVVLALLGPALGGATELWTQALLVAGAATIMLWRPPHFPISRPLLMLFFILMALACLGFLPAAWFRTIPFRTNLVQIQQTTLPGTLSMQPWQTLEGALLLAATLTWTGFLLAHAWSAHRRSLLAFYAAGLVAMTILAFFFYLAGPNRSLWRPVNGAFGFFPNRAQTGLVLATGGVACLALAFRQLIDRHQKGGYLWVGGYLLMMAGAYVNGDGPSWVLFAIGSGLWLVWATWPKSRHRLMGIALGLVILVLMAVGLHVQHIHAQSKAVPGAPVLLPDSSPARIQLDALRLLREASWHGLGLGNFEPVFAHYRVASKANDRVRHPENDLLWAGIEMGWLAPAVLLAALVLFLGQNWPRHSRSDFHVRSACAVSALLLFTAGFIGVPGHRLGAIWPVLFLLGLCRATPATGLESKRVQFSFRLLGLSWAAVAVVWIGSVFGLVTVPTSARPQFVKQTFDSAIATGRFQDAIAQAGEGLRWAPLDWTWYFQRAAAELYADPFSSAAIFDFHRARFLEPNSVQVPFEESKVWLARHPALVFSSFFEILRRAGPAKIEYFRQILKMGKGVPAVEEELFSLAYRDRELLVAFLDYASPNEFKQELDKLLEEDPDLLSLDKSQQREVFRLWREKGDSASYEQQLNQHPKWLENAWMGLAAIRAGRGEFKAACELAQRYATPPNLPANIKQRPVPEMTRALLFAKDDFATGYALYRAYAQANDVDAALKAVSRMTEQAKCPLYFHFLEANLRAMREEWEAAWKAWEKFF